MTSKSPNKGVKQTKSSTTTTTNYDHYFRYLNLAVLCTALKLLLIPTYTSTDFEVHRNWLAITSSLPVSKWYIEATSIWTLDYPPFFAWFEYTLSLFARLFDEKMLVVSNLNYISERTLIFQRLSVIITDLLFYISSYLLSQSLFSSNNNTNNNSNNNNQQESTSFYKDSKFIVFAILICNPGLLMVDHIHFQYNGFLKGIMLLSIYFMSTNRPLLGGLVFAILLNFKHIYMYLAPAYFTYLLLYYCIARGINFMKFIGLGVTVLVVFSVSLGPFIYYGQIPQLLSRLFPFGRGLTHAYWAPNFWAFYNFVDRVAIMVKSKYFGIDMSAEAGMLTSGLVDSDTQAHVILPAITPLITLLITIISLLPSLYGIIKSNKLRVFILGVTQCCFSFFMFGWHVHEKAIIMVTIPLGLLALDSIELARIYFVLSTIGHYSLFPLLFQSTEIPIRIAILLTYTLALYLALQSKLDNNDQSKRFSLTRLELLYVIGIIPLEIFNIFIHPVYLAARLPFLSLMLTSIYCSVGVLYCYIQIMIQIFKTK
ncbi:glycosyltransferase [Heterostelium album PN500]|uniref:Alpha-1,3-glucosyltransferase n=1 Tax=Heterostelium pallidum (strain ATCC 26659 / Pp 5 / PN500) TaxID=670386 RepID=D3BMH9_HETP5|nr:glycosyltransferase [Heterostelium album PN500]EFA77191.1 glycosyltransferase [Heterostelium album PN500]|eukprot:XP_020429320.1 glycosyltransferase [Heterostelium album PN500]